MPSLNEGHAVFLYADDLPVPLGHPIRAELLQTQEQISARFPEVASGLWQGRTWPGPRPIPRRSKCPETVINPQAPLPIGAGPGIDVTS